MANNSILDPGENYIVQRNPDDRSQWHYQIYRNKLDEYAAKGDFSVVIVADAGTEDQKVFVIPYQYLQKEVLSKADLDSTGRYLFNISKANLKFNWQHGVPMNGNDFLHPELRSASIPRETMSSGDSNLEDGTEKNIVRLETSQLSKKRFWWVNQGTTNERETTGGYLWAPQKTKSGKVLGYHANLNRLQKDDVVFHYAKGKLRGISTVTEEAVKMARPADSLGEKSDQPGLLARVNFRKLQNTIDLNSIPRRWRVEEVGPFTKSGTVKEGYLFEISQSFAERLISILGDGMSDIVDGWISAGGLTGRKYWVFQANPRNFDLAGAILELSQIRFVTQQHATRIHEGDVVFLWESGRNAGVVAVGTIVADPAVLPQQEEAMKFLKNQKKFSGAQLRVPIRIDRVLSTRIKRTLLLNHPILESLGVLRAPQATNFPMTRAQVQALIELISKQSGDVIDFPLESEPPPTRMGAPGASLGQRLNYPSVLDDDPIWKQVQELLSMEIRNILFIGPPGTSKTDYALRVGSKLADYQPRRFHNIQLHPSYSYEDFMMGYVPTENPKNPSPFERKPKLFLKVCNSAREDSPDTTHVLVIDELNRGDPSRVFGEALTYIERRNEWFEIPNSDERCLVPSNLVIMATINPYDKSIADLDDAMFRRFEGKIMMNPDVRLLREIVLEFNHVDPKLGGKIISFFERLNVEMDNRVGHAHFKSVKDIHTLVTSWNHSILPFLQRELRYDRDKLERIASLFKTEFEANTSGESNP